MKTNRPARATLTGSFSLLLVACADLPQPTPIEISMSNVRSADYGTYPEHYEQQIHQYLNDTLLDPDSAKIRIAPPRKVNAKNAYGGYTGWQTKRYRFTNGSMEDEQNFSYQNSIDSDACYSEDEIFIDTQNLDKLKVNIVP